MTLELDQSGSQGRASTRIALAEATWLQASHLIAQSLSFLICSRAANKEAWESRFSVSGHTPTGDTGVGWETLKDTGWARYLFSDSHFPPTIQHHRKLNIFTSKENYLLLLKKHKCILGTRMQKLYYFFQTKYEWFLCCRFCLNRLWVSRTGPWWRQWQDCLNIEFGIREICVNVGSVTHQLCDPGRDTQPLGALASLSVKWE